MLQKPIIRGFFTMEHVRDGKIMHKEKGRNGITNEGFNDALDVLFNAGTQNASWYLGLIDSAGFTGLSAADTHETHTGWAESEDYDEATRPEWSPDDPAALAITNSSVVIFTMDAVKTIKGIFVTSHNVKGNSDSGHILWATALFSTQIPTQISDLIRVTYGLEISEDV